MRKILTSVLSVAGLLAVVMALASSPASAAKDVVTITSADQAGTYTVSWETQGGCEPGSGTSGASGSVTLTVAASTPGGTTGAAVETGVVIDDICKYEWDGSFVNAAGAVCEITLPAVDQSKSDKTITITGGTDCTTMSDVVVTIVGADASAAVLCTADDVTNKADTGCDNVGDVKTAAVASALNGGAVAATTFTVTATPAGDDPHDDCLGDSGDTAVAEEGQPNEVTLSLVDATAGDSSDDGNCTYDISVALPNGFVAGSKGSDVMKNVNPEAGAGDDDDATDNVDLTVAVATRSVYLVQRVHGDAGGGNAKYELAGVDQCSAPGLPSILEPAEASGGIHTVGGQTVVELRTGAFNITGALTGMANSGDAKMVAALDSEGNACEASVSISGVPAHCTAASNSPQNLAISGDQVIIGFDIDCTEPEPAAPAPEPEAPMGGDDMTGDDDMDMGGDDMDMGGDDMDDGGDMGPPADTPTG